MKLMVRLHVGCHKRTTSSPGVRSILWHFLCSCPLPTKQFTSCRFSSLVTVLCVHLPRGLVMVLAGHVEKGMSERSTVSPLSSFGRIEHHNRSQALSLSNMGER
jgi:hypothetical protein